MYDEQHYVTREYTDDKADALPDVIEKNDYVRINEAWDGEFDQDVIYLQDIQSIGVVREHDYPGWLIIEFVRGRYVLHSKHVYLVDVDALHGEMEEMIAEEAAEAEQSESAPKGAICAICGEDMLSVDDCAHNRTITYEDGTVLSAIRYDSERRGWNMDNRCHDCNVAVGNYHHPGCDVEECPRCHRQLISCDCGVKNETVTEEKQVAQIVLSEAKQKQADAVREALSELDTLQNDMFGAANEVIARLQARIALLEKTLTPFALAALEDDYVKTGSEHTSEQLYTYDTLWEHEQGIWFNGGNTALTRTHLREALEALPEVAAANADSEQA